MVSALHTALENGLGLAHLWRTDSPVGCPHPFDDEVTGSRSGAFESFFQSIPEFPPFVNRGQSVRLFYEEGNEFFHSGLNVVEVVGHPCAGFQYHGPFTENDLANVEAVLVLTSLNFPVKPAKKIQLYQRYFKPLDCYLRTLEGIDELLGGKWLCVHLRTAVRTAFSLPEWNLEDLVEKTMQLTRDIEFDRIIVFSDCLEARAEFASRQFGKVPVNVLNWENQSTPAAMFLDFLAISKASLILSSGISSFSYEASLFGGGVPIFDMCQGLLLPEAM